MKNEKKIRQPNFSNQNVKEDYEKIILKNQRKEKWLNIIVEALIIIITVAFMLIVINL